MLEGEVVFARRLALFALGQVDVSPSTLPFHTAWRHRFLDFLIGKGYARFSDLVETMGEGYFGAIHYQVLKTAIVAGLIPSKELTDNLQKAFEQHMNRCNAAYSTFLKNHFQGFKGLKELSPEHWGKAMALFERLVVPAPPSFRAQVMSAIGEVWSSNGWGGIELDGRSWHPIAELGLIPNQDLLDHIGRLGTFNISRPLVTTFYDHEAQRQRGLLLLPVNHPGQSPALIWILNDHQPNSDLAGLYEPSSAFMPRSSALSTKSAQPSCPPVPWVHMGSLATASR